MKKQHSFFSFKNLIVILVIALIISSYLAIHNYRIVSQIVANYNEVLSQKDRLQEQINTLNSEIENKKTLIDSQSSEISSLNVELEQKKREIETLLKRVNALEEELGITKTKLQETTLKYETAKPYQERIDRGQYLSESYTLLQDTEDYTKPLVLSYLGLTAPTAPANDDELWERGRLIYNWISNNYEYCGDKGLRVGSTFAQFQFWSPDEILQSDNARCGDCDDFAILFAGLMYASGVPEDKVWVVCGSVPGGGHCWNWITLKENTYLVDPVCSQKTTILNLFGLNFGVKSAYFTSTKQNVGCFSSYTSNIRMNPQEFIQI